MEVSVRREMDTRRRTGALSPCVSRDGITERRHGDDVSDTTPFTSGRKEHTYDRGATDRMDQIASSTSEGEANGERRQVEHMRGQDRQGLDWTDVGQLSQSRLREWIESLLREVGEPEQHGREDRTHRRSVRQLMTVSLGLISRMQGLGILIRRRLLVEEKIRLRGQNRVEARGRTGSCRQFDWDNTMVRVHWKHIWRNSKMCQHIMSGVIETDYFI
jgi:hypothetical protein